MANGTSRFSYQRLERPGKFEKGEFTVLFVDVVKFTKFGDNEKLRKVVRELHNAIIDVFQALEWDVGGPVTQNSAIMIPTGDGYGIGFEPLLIEDAVALRYAAELSSRLDQEGCPIRSGINRGPCYVHKDVNGRLNLAGWGIVDAGRAMECGEKNHILCTQSFAAPLIQAKKEENLQEIGKYFAKGRPLELYNYAGDGFGNRSRPKLTSVKRATKRTDK